MVLEFPIMADYGLMVLEGKAFTPHTDMYTTRITFRHCRTEISWYTVTPIYWKAETIEAEGKQAYCRVKPRLRVHP